MNTSPFAPTRSIAQEPSRLQALIWLGLFAAAAALLGGSSRFDAVQIAALRPVAALFLIPAFYWISREKLGEARAPMTMLALMALWTALQLVPLPPSIWQALPGRDIIAELDALHGLEGNWRPISYVPMRGFNALFALVVPAAGALLVLALRPGIWAVFWAIAALGVVDAALGLAQILFGPGNPLYFYTHTNAGAPVGIFANENHSGVFSALVLLVIARLGLDRSRPNRSRLSSIALTSAFVLILLALLVSASRAALGVGIAALLASALMALLWSRRAEHARAPSGGMAFVARNPRTALIVGIAAVVVLLYALMQFERAPGVIDTFEQSAFEDLRWRIVPILSEMMSRHWLVGTGFGTFDALYLLYEPTEFMGPAYVNQAHNDWAQIVIEGGLPAVALIAAFAIWAMLAIRSLFAREPEALARCVFWCAIAAILAVASLFDYPLRTPTFQLVAAWFVIALALERRNASKQH